MKRLAFAALLVLPLCLLHARAGAEICIAIIDALFLTHLTFSRHAGESRHPRRLSLSLSATKSWLLIALLWWAWEVICSTPIPGTGFGASGLPGLIQALLLLRYIILTAALESWLLTTPAARRALWLTIALSCLWIGLECWQQYLTGHNIFGDPPWPVGGMLTGPFSKPRAATAYAHILATALLPVTALLLARKAGFSRLAAYALTALAIATIILIGQRTPIALVVLSLAAAAFFIPRFRLPALAGCLTAAAVLAATPLIAPAAYARVVVLFSHQMSHFASSDYGRLYGRALTMVFYSPWHGYGFDGFRTLCPLPLFSLGLPGYGLAPTQPGLACNLHPHNFYLQALTDAGLPGLSLFTAMNLAWLLALGRGLRQNPDPLRVGLFAGVLTFAWPLASTDNFATLPHAGWLFLLLGLGLAMAHISPNPNPSDSSHV
jgi:O-antigen ligase